MVPEPLGRVMAMGPLPPPSPGSASDEGVGSTH